MKDINIGFIGAGKIAHALAETINHTDGIINYAVAARDLSRAKKFQEQYGFKKAYGSYEEMLKDENVDAVYISTIHSLHVAHSLLALKYHKPVLCEKTLTTSLKDTTQLYKKFEENNLLLVEALWTSFQPFNDILKSLIFEKKVIGELKEIKAYFYMDGFLIERIRNKEMGGGAMLDIGIYPISFIFRLLTSKYSSLKILKFVKENNVDSKVDLLFTYPHGIKALASVDVNTKQKDNYAKIIGTNGYILANSTNYPTEIKVYDLNDNLIQNIDCSHIYGGFIFEVIDFVKALNEQQIECKKHTHQDSIEIARVQDLVINK